ncbi:MAG: GTP-dependent dephospho-CoA kinase family protein [Candidatus Bathyarchaeia archaeon]
MIQIRFLTESQRIQLKTPLGRLLKGSFSQTMREFETVVETKKPTMIISVGDAVSETLLKHNIFPKVLIVDSVVMRKPIEPLKTESYKTVCIQNKAGTISDEAWLAIESAIKKSSKVKVVVEGEEDLLALVAILSAPEKSLVVYGQPREGMVVVEVTAEKKDEIRAIVEAMEQRTVSKS